MGGGKAATESKADKEARQRERRVSGLERNRATQQSASDLTNQIRMTYGQPSLFSLMR